MPGLTGPIRPFLATAPVAHVVTLETDGAPQVWPRKSVYGLA